MIPAPVRYRRPSSLDDALDALREPEARALAGGQSLLPVMKLRIAQPSVVVDIGRLSLDGMQVRDGELRIGASTVWEELARPGSGQRLQQSVASALESSGLAALRECAGGIGDLQVRNRGTVGGSVAHADPASDIPAALLALGASLEIRSADGGRRVALEDFFLGPFMTALAPGELITEIAVPVPPDGAGSAYAKLEHPASGFALAGAAALVLPDGSRRIAVTGVGATPFLLPDGAPEAIADAEIYGDRFAPEEYRRHIARVVVDRALALAEERAG